MFRFHTSQPALPTIFEMDVRAPASEPPARAPNRPGPAPLSPSAAPADPEAGFRRPAAPPPPAAATGTAAPLSGRLTRPAGQSHKLSAKQHFLQRPITTGSKLIGIGAAHSQERPRVVGLPERAAAAAVDDQRLVAAAGDLGARVKRILDTTLEQLPDVNQRPGRSDAMEALTSVWPLSLFKAKKIRELIQQDPGYAVAGGAGRPAAPAGGHTPNARLALLAKVDAGLQTLARAETSFRDAQQKLADSEIRLAAARAELAAPAGVAAAAAARDGLRDNVARLEAAQGAGRHALAGSRKELDAAIRALHGAVTLNTLLGANHNALTADLLQRKTEFVTQQIADCKLNLSRAEAGTPAQRGAFEKYSSLLAQAVKNAEQAETLAMTELESLRDRRRQLTAELAVQVAAADAAAASGIGGPLTAIPEEEGDPADELENLAHVLPQFERAHQEVAQALQMVREKYRDEQARLVPLGQAMAVLDTAAAQVAPKADHWKTLSARTAALESEHHGAALAALIATAPGFSAEQLVAPGAAALKAHLGLVAESLPEDDPQAERTLPRLAVIEIISHALADINGGDAGQAAAMLQQLMQQPSHHWSPVDGEGAAPPAELRALFHLMAEVPRGMELLDRIGARDGRGTMGRAQLEGLHAYWMADKEETALQAEVEAGPPGAATKAEAGVRTWLANAKTAASHAMRHDKDAPAGHDPAALPRAQRIAYRGVCLGQLSNAPASEYGFINQACLKVGDDWVEDAKDERGKLRRMLPRSPFKPTKGRTPFDAKTLRLASKQLEAQGMPSVKSSAHRQVAQAAAGLSAKLAEGGLRGKAGAPGEAGLDREQLHYDLAAQVVCDYIARQKDAASAAEPLVTATARTGFERTKRLYKAELGKQDFELIRREFADRVAQSAGRAAAPPRPTGRLVKPMPAGTPAARPGQAAPLELPASIRALLEGPDTKPLAVLRGITAHLDAHMPAAAKAELGMADLDADLGFAAVDQAIVIANRKRFEKRADVLDFYRPMLQELRLRNQLIMTAGGEIGGGIPLLPWSPIAPFVANINLNIFSRKREASFQVKSPTYGVELIMADTTTRASDAKGTLGFGLDLGPFKLNLPAVSLKIDRSRAETEFAVLRVLRNKDKSGVREEQVARDDSLDLLDTLLNWETKHADGEEPFSGPLEAILALHPAVLVGSGKKTNNNRQLGADVAVAARAPFAAGHLSGGIGITPLSVKAESAKEVSDERSGYAHQGVHDASHQVRQRANASASVGGLLNVFRTPVNPDAAGGHADAKGSWRMMAPINVLDFSRDLAFNLEKNGATRFAIGDKSGGSVDRVYGTAKDLLAEIEANEEDFYLRFLDTVVVEPGAERNTQANRELAAAALKAFKEDLKDAKKNANLQFNIKYEMQPRISGWVDSLKALEALALARGDTQAAREHREARSELLSFRSSWAFKNGAIRSKGKDSDDAGFDFVVRLLAKHSAETSVAVAAYPA